MAATAKKSDPELWDKVKRAVTAGDKGGRAGEWSARKAQLAVQEYKKKGGGYVGRKSKDNQLKQWTDQEWRTRSGEKSRETGERYLPEAAHAKLSKDEYDRTTAKKRKDTREGRQFSKQPEDVARKSASARKRPDRGPTKAELLERARRKGIPGRSRMTKEELARALG